MVRFLTILAAVALVLCLNPAGTTGCVIAHGSSFPVGALTHLLHVPIVHPKPPFFQCLRHCGEAPINDQLLPSHET